MRLAWHAVLGKVIPSNYPNNPRKLTPHQATLKCWTFKTESWSRSGRHPVKENPQKSRRESISKLPGGCQLSWVVRVGLNCRTSYHIQPSPEDAIQTEKQTKVYALFNFSSKKYCTPLKKTAFKLGT